MDYSSAAVVGGGTGHNFGGLLIVATEANGDLAAIIAQSRVA